MDISSQKATLDIHVCMVVVGRPVLAEVIKELGPRLDLVPLEVGDRKGKPVINPGDERDVLMSLLDQPFGDLLTAPVLVDLLARRWRER